MPFQKMDRTSLICFAVLVCIQQRVLYLFLTCVRYIVCYMQLVLNIRIRLDLISLVYVDLFQYYNSAATIKIRLYDVVSS